MKTTISLALILLAATPAAFAQSASPIFLSLLLLPVLVYVHRHCRYLLDTSLHQQGVAQLTPHVVANDEKY